MLQKALLMRPCPTDWDWLWQPAAGPWKSKDAFVSWGLSFRISEKRCAECQVQGTPSARPRLEASTAQARCIRRIIAQKVTYDTVPRRTESGSAMFCLQVHLDVVARQPLPEVGPSHGI